MREINEKPAASAAPFNKNFNLTGTAIGEFDFLVLAIRFLKY